MRTGFKRLLVMMLTAVLAISMLAGCSSKPKASDAQAYVQAVLDMLCTGDYDHSSTKLVDIEEGTETEVRDTMVQQMIDSISGEANLSDEVKAQFTDLMLDAFSKAKYTVGDAVEADDGFDVTVTIEPLRLYAGIGDDFEAEVQKRAMEDIDKISSMSDDEQTNYIMGIMIEMLKDGLKDPQYAEAEEVTVHYGVLDEEGNYGCSSEEGQKLGEKIFAVD